MLGFHVLWGLSIDVMVFILYKLYILSPYTAPIPKPNHHRRHSAILHFQKTSLSLIYKLVSSWGPKNVPTRTRILDIAILVGTFCPHNVGFTWTTHTHTHTHTQSSGQPFMLRRPRSSWGFGALLKGTSSWHWGRRERWTFTPPTDNSC